MPENRNYTENDFPVSLDQKVEFYLNLNKGYFLNELYSYLSLLHLSISFLLSLFYSLSFQISLSVSLFLFRLLYFFNLLFLSLSLFFIISFFFFYSFFFSFSLTLFYSLSLIFLYIYQNYSSYYFLFLHPDVFFIVCLVHSHSLSYHHFSFPPL